MTNTGPKVTPETKAYRLSKTQESIWLASNLQPGPLYTIPYGLHIQGDVDETRLEDALFGLIQRHEALRTSIQVIDNEPRQLAHDPVFDFRWDDVRSENHTVDAIRRTLREQMEVPFDLDSGELLTRLRGLRFDDRTRAILITVHHTCIDGASTNVISRDLQALYNNAGPVNDKTALQFGTFADWEQSQLESGAWQDQREYWRDTLRNGMRSVRPQPENELASSTDGRTVVAPRLDSARLKDVDAFAQAANITRPAFFLSTLFTLLHKLTKTQEATVGMPFARRDRPLLSEVIGPILNTAPVSAHLETDLVFEELARSVNTSVLEALEHQDLPWEEVSKDLKVDRGGRLSNSFDVMFNWESRDDSETRFGTARACRVYVDDHECKTPLAWYLNNSAESLETRVVYQTSEYSSAQVDELVAQWLQVIDQVLAKPDVRLRDVSLANDASESRVQKLEEATFATDVSVQELVRRQATIAPDAVAIEQDGRAWTYSELVAASDTIADRLAELGLAPRQVCAVVAKPSPILLALILAIWARGAVYFPIDVRIPTPRRHTFLDASQAAVLVDVTGTLELGEDHRELWSGETGRRVAAVVRTQCAQDRLTYGPDVSYALFTSGTTGEPKPVWGRSSSLTTFLRWLVDEFDIAPTDRLAQVNHLGFDPSFRETFAALIAGATVCIPPDGSTLSDAGMVDWLKETQATTIMPVPSVAKWWLRSAPDNACSTIRKALFAGEPLRRDLVQDWRRVFPACTQVFNLYGPAEITHAAAYLDVPDPPKHETQLIGSPRPRTRLVVVDENGRHAGLGELGELYVETAHPTLTVDPRTGEPMPGFSEPDGDGVYRYRSGDLGRMRTDGLVQIAGRVDDQTKINGLRVSPAEVASLIARHTMVKDCVVVQVEGDDGYQLDAHVIPSVSVDDSFVPLLKRWMRSQVPQGMVPARIGIVDQYPLTSNGKLDRSALPTLTSVSEDRGRLPRPGTETTVAQIVADVLGLSDISATTDLFEIGAHSLLVTQIVSRITTATSVKVPFSRVFDIPTVEGIAAAADGSTPSSAQGACTAVASLADLNEAELDSLLAHFKRNVEERHDQ